MPEPNVPTVQRAYTLQLRGGRADPKDRSWRDALWRTHETVNKGAKLFGDWLLTLRGGLDHTLADAQVKVKVKGEKERSCRNPSPEERKARRILLALSWLSVESKSGVPEPFVIASGQETAADRNRKVVAALEEILASRNVAGNEIDGWEKDCSASLSAAIRDDAVWVNRSKAFDHAVQSVGCSLTREEAWDMLERFFGSREAYLAPAKGSDDDSSDTEQGEGSGRRRKKKSASSEDDSSDTGQEEKAKDLVQKAGQWLSSRFGTGKGADFSRMAGVYQKIADWSGAHPPGKPGADAIADLAAALREFEPASNELRSLLGLISGPGYKSATRNLLVQIADQTAVIRENLTKLHETATADKEKCETNTGSKGQRPYADAILRDVESACGFTYRRDETGNAVSVSNYPLYPDHYSWQSAMHSEFAVMLDHAARRVSLAHTWIKRAEAERRRFEADSEKINQVPEAAKEWLDAFCRERSEASGALEPYRIRRRALDGWKKVVAAWSKNSCKTPDDRIAAARELQDDPDIKKFGDIRLFEALAEDDAVCVWHKDGDAEKAPDPQPLMDYVLADEASFKKRHFKVPAYRHPDALLHPVFCDFGNSRWEIDFSIREAAAKLDQAKAKISKAEETVRKAKNAWEKRAGNESLENKAREKLREAEKTLAEAQQELQRLSSLHRMSMTLWNGKDVAKTPLCWQSKKLVQDLTLDKTPAQDASKPVEVSRADRLGRAASNAAGSDNVKIAGLFEQNDWNGRLQTPRRQLETIARQVEKHGWDEKTRKMRDNLRWLVTFSAKLQPQGPWREFAENRRLTINPQYWPHADANEHRQGHARLILSRLPGLRVLSVDLGHRYAAACAVWEALSIEQVQEACRAAGQEEPKTGDLYLHLKKKVKKQKKAREVEVEETTVYRRIGADILPDPPAEASAQAGGTPHPAPWARLDRQFLVRLQGEEEGAREASNEEIWRVHQLEAELGRTAPMIDRLVKTGWGQSGKQKTRLDALRHLGWTPAQEAPNSEETEEGELRKPSLSVDELLSSSVRTMRLALMRHGDRARIAHYLVTDEKAMPGGIKKQLDDPGRIALLQDALALWHGLASSRGWRDDTAKQLWDAHIAHCSGYQAPEEIGEDASSMERKKRQKKNREKLHDVAEALARDATLRKTLHHAWSARWKEDDERWKKRLRWFKDWILPRGKAAQDPAIRKVGGLSLTRLATLTEFRRKIQVGFFTRLHPDGTKTETKDQFGQSTLDALEHLREQRVKQLASRIAEAALGVGSEGGKGWDGWKRPRQRIDDPRFAPCHAIVVENLTHYRPEETRARRENRQLMSWSSSKVEKYLSEACQLHGLHLREVSAGYTSRQDSRTGAPGIRCQDVPVKEFMRSSFWRKQVAQAGKKQAGGKGDARERFLRGLNAMWKEKPPADWAKAGTVRIPLQGGEIFVSANRHSPAAKGIQADLNAAANIGLRALMDPDWPGKWWYLPCETGSFRPVKETVAGSAAVYPDRPLRQPDQAQSETAEPPKKKRGSKSATKAHAVVNLWRDLSSSSLYEGEWKAYAAYQNETQSRVVRLLEEQLEARAKQPSEGAMEDDLLF